MFLVPVGAQHEDAQAGECGQPGDLSDVVVIQVEEDEPPQVREVLDLRDQVVLEVEQSQILLSLQQGADEQIPPARGGRQSNFHTV